MVKRISKSSRFYSEDGKKLIKILDEDADGEFKIEVITQIPDDIRSCTYTVGIQKVTKQQLRNLIGVKKRDKLIIAE